MKYTGMPQIMWSLYKNSFKKNLVTDLGFTKDLSEEITRKAKVKYKGIIEKLPEFEKGDRFLTNTLSCAQFIAFLSSMPRRPGVDEATVYYRDAMTIAPTKMMCRTAGKSKFSQKDLEAQRRTADLKAADRNPYSWNMDLIVYGDGSGYEARFLKCGICYLMKEYGFFDLVPAMCRLDYTMSELGGASVFVREYTLAEGGPYCDCGYKKKFP
ncbi:MAG: L-2-amino-thiazoline-4-carboxylic acid hydrolase [Clostridiales bacterium]|nr:L-2-amino-thiazoline-4-carboxylic acid hydrolase [Clostridiales bacterium]HAW15709.1 hypothetical protein [Clostridiales bacterium]